MRYFKVFIQLIKCTFTYKISRNLRVYSFIKNVKFAKYLFLGRPRKVVYGTLLLLFSFCFSIKLDFFSFSLLVKKIKFKSLLSC